MGAMVARYFKEWDPFWFYFHASVQSLGFILGFIGVISGLVLNNQLQVDVSLHKVLGIIILVLASLQMMAMLARPNKASKMRKSSPDVWSFIFSFPTSINAYAAIGFSNDGKMVKSSALVGWISGVGGGGMNEYYLGGLSEPDVVPRKGDLNYMNATIIQPDPSLVYMIFQLKTNQPSSKLIYSIGPNGVFPDAKGNLQQHSDAISTVIDYSQG
ncbi:hypothetical protein PIB30_100694 [Stylosanthes scabra]|uniref:Cytochrome b561 and DOMON domain-containing protein n=1 Tax=Stylosanthes scabra TaxID=79078 RepID=A0ABU6RXK6_9FABA|nr:hypothetical protein [Stylosanthes scabra]